MKNTRRKFLQITGAGLAASTLCSQANQQLPNILFLFSDQHRAMDLQCMGNKALITPNIDLLAREGILFNNAIANCPLCTPSRATLLTGKYPIGHRCLSNDLPLPTDQETIATVLSKRGYKTGYIGKWHLDGISRHKFTPPGLRRHGFNDYWAAYNCNHNYFQTRYYFDTSERIDRNGYEPDIQTDLAIDFLHQYSSSPFFLTISYGPPHSPYEMVPEHYKAFYDPETIPLRANVENPNRKATAGYYAHITALDVCVGRLLRVLDELKLRENTIVVYTSDHGDMLWSHGRVNKQQPWEESINVPLIVRYPNQIQSGQRSNLLVGTADLAPTLLAMTDSPIPSEMQGLDLSRQILHQNGAKHDSILLVDMLTCDQAKQWNGRPWRGVRTHRYTYARFHDAGWVLYDNQNDPMQMNNLYDNPQHASLQKQMEDELQNWLEQLGDEFLSEEEVLKKMNLAEAWKERNEHFQSGKNW